MVIKKNIYLGFAIVLTVAGIVFFLSYKYIPETPAVKHENDAAMEDLSAMIDDINIKLDSVRRQHSDLIIDLDHTELGSKRERIMNNIIALGSLINKSEEQIRTFRKRLEMAQTQNGRLNQKLLSYENSREDILRELEDLKYELQLTEKENVKLNNALNKQTINSDRLKAKLNATENIAYAAYYVYGDRQQLKRLNIIHGEGKDLPLEEFEKVDMRAEAIIPTHSKNVKLITSHVNNSYTWQDDDQGNKNLCIVEPLQFWKNSRYLIIEVK